MIIGLFFHLSARRGPEFRGNDYIPSPPVDGNPAYKETRSTRKSGDCKKGGGKTLHTEGLLR